MVFPGIYMEGGTYGSHAIVAKPIIETLRSTMELHKTRWLIQDTPEDLLSTKYYITRLHLGLGV